MDSPLIGSPNRSIELLRIESNLFNLYIHGKPFHPTVDSLQLHRNEERQLIPAQLLVSSTSSVLVIEKLYVFNPEVLKLVDWQTGEAAYPLFFETQSYEFVVEKKEDVPIAFFHENLNIRQAVKPLGRGSILSGVLNFQNEVGLTDLELRMHGKTLLSLQLEIFPVKMDYKRDYQMILNDVNQQIYNLSFDFLRKTYNLTGLKETKNQSLTEFFSILKHVFSHLIQAVERIQFAPHSKHQVENRIVSSGQVRKPGKKNIQFLSKHPHLLVQDNHGIVSIHGQRYNPSHALETKRYVDYDTNENRFVRWVLQRIAQKLKALKQRLTEKGKLLDPHLSRQLTDMQSQMQRLLGLDFLQVKDMNKLSITIVLQMAPGYRDVYRNYLMLMKGLSIQSDLFHLSMKDLAQLYEYWCFLKIHDLLSRKYELLKQDIIKVNRTGIFVTLDKTQKAKVVYRNPKNGEEFTLYYNTLPLGEKTHTVAQRPDNVLTLKKNDSKTVYKYVFDAKYRLDPAYEGTPYSRNYKIPGPEESDINTMHRYRDAIVCEEERGDGIERSMFGAFVLFPYHDEEQYKEHRFYKSIQLVNVGAFPFLPNATKLMEAFLDEIISDSPERSYERATRPSGTKTYYQNQLSGRNVLVGSMRRVEQLDEALKHSFYHVPLENLTDHTVLSQLEYVALYQSVKQFESQGRGSGIQWYGKIKDWKVLRRSEISEIPARAGTENKLYVKFTVERWMKREKSIIPGGHGIYSLLLTSIYIFDRADEVAELRLETEEDIRLWREKRRQGRLKVELDHEQADLASKVEAITDVE
ncbi:restriction endonuclease-like protein [Paenibacillus silvisoli]|uniref:restriction endonuclease-like protein n=1 Tax=Paenibacillus silvisoli TaxID=3110539 RepID=UPI00280472FB|nr:restriction endonuclease-like protein [Paenibacillus silvisoli]